MRNGRPSHAGRLRCRRRGGAGARAQRTRSTSAPSTASAAACQPARPSWHVASSSAMTSGSTPATVEDFRRSGLSHLLAVSGQNVALLALLAMPLLAALGMPLRVRLVWILGAIAVYVPLAGAGPSILRAGVMGAPRRAGDPGGPPRLAALRAGRCRR